LAGSNAPWPGLHPPVVPPRFALQPPAPLPEREAEAAPAAAVAPPRTSTTGRRDRTTPNRPRMNVSDACSDRIQVISVGAPNKQAPVHVPVPNSSPMPFFFFFFFSPPMASKTKCRSTSPWRCGFEKTRRGKKEADGARRSKPHRDGDRPTRPCRLAVRLTPRRCPGKRPASRDRPLPHRRTPETQGNETERAGPATFFLNDAAYC